MITPVLFDYVGCSYDENFDMVLKSLGWFTTGKGISRFFQLSIDSNEAIQCCYEGIHFPHPVLHQIEM